MSKDIGVLKNTGSRNTDIKITRYFGGKEKGVCVQLTAMMEEGEIGYIQLNKSDINTLFYIFVQYVFDQDIMHLIDFKKERSND